MSNTTDTTTTARFVTERGQGRDYFVVDTANGEKAAKFRSMIQAQADADARNAAAEKDAKKAAKAPKAEPVADGVLDVAAMDRIERLNLAKVEAREMREWKLSDRSTEPPATPVLDWMADPANDVTKTTRARKSGERKPRQPKDAELLAKTVEFVKAQRAAGTSWFKVAKALNEAGILTQKGSTWYYSTVTLFARQNGLD